jgi:MoaA/NifB/PqqE/SkfB family radical SAM enzyme
MGALLRAKLARESRPLWVDVAVTNRCHLDCEYCYGDYHHRKDEIGQFRLEQLHTILDDAAALGTKVACLTGGEPMLHKSIIQIIERAASHNMAIGMVTSGFRVRERTHELAALSWIVISLDGPEPVHDLNRGKGSFAVALSALEAVQRQGIPRVIKSVLNRRNQDQLPWLLDTTARLGARLEVVMSYAPQSERQLRVHGDMSLDRDERQALAEALLAYKQRGAPLVFRERVYDNLARWWQSHRSDRVQTDEVVADFPYLPCSAGRYYAFIDGDGRMYPCNQRIAEFDARNVLEVGVRGAWEHLRDHGCFACAAPWLNQQHLVNNIGRRLLRA